MEEVKEVVNDSDAVQTPTVSQENSISKQLATFNNNSLSRVNLFDDKQLVAAENFITKIRESINFIYNQTIKKVIKPRNLMSSKNIYRSILYLCTPTVYSKNMTFGEGTINTST